jgi:hypothetical protein
MTGLRDARLHKALESAPDAQLRPDARTRQAILATAHEAVAPAPARAWWRALWDSTGSQRMPWNAAFATIVVASLVTVLWHDREVPDARPEMAPGAPPTAAVPAPSAPPASAPAVAPAPRATRAPVAEVQLPRKSAAKPSQPQPQPQLGLAQGQARPDDAARERRAESGALRDEDSRALAKSTPQPVEAPAAAPAAGPVAELSSRAAAPAPAPSAAPATAPAPAFAPPPAPAPAAPAAMARAVPPAVVSQAAPPAADMAPPAPRPAPRADPASQLRAADARAWSSLRLESGGRAVVVGREQALRLAQLLDQILTSPRGNELIATAPQARLELSQQSARLGMLEVVGDQLLWVPTGGGPQFLRPDPEVLRALKEEIQRVLGR